MDLLTISSPGKFMFRLYYIHFKVILLVIVAVA